MIDAFTTEQELARAGEAERLMATPMFQEAVKSVTDNLQTLRQRVPVADQEMAWRIVQMEQLFNYLLDHLRGVMMNGASAREKLRLREYAMDRMNAAMKHGLRNVGLY